MTHAEIFKDIFGLYATEVWSMPESEFLNWLNEESRYNDKKYQNTSLKTDRDGVSEKDKICRRVFKGIVVKYPECKGKPYFSIKYTENGQEFIGYGTYKPEVLSEYLKEYFMPPAQPEIIYCSECKYMMPNGWCMEFADDSVRVSASGFCSAAERKDDK